MSVETALLRVAQGALANVTQHAQATSTWVELEYTAEQVVISVRDDGSGFDPASLNATGGNVESFGLKAIRDRATQLDGSAEVASTPWAGTTVRVSLPNAAEPAQESTADRTDEPPGEEA